MAFPSIFASGSTLERITDAVAIVAVITGLNPSFYYWLSEISGLAALLMPVLGCMWLGVQIWVRVTKGK
jgi:hypothetical protein